MPLEIRHSYDSRAEAFLNFMFRALMGTQWIDQHYAPQKARRKKIPGFFEYEEADDAARETKIHRMLDLIEMVYNLQSTPGFLPFFVEFRKSAPNKFEGLYAQLQIAKMLSQTGYPFRFVKEIRQPQSDYDFEMMLPGECIVCVEAKCREEQWSVDPEVLTSKLKKARRQLPDDAPGIILFKVPQHWYVDHTIGDQLRTIARLLISLVQTFEAAGIHYEPALWAANLFQNWITEGRIKE